VVGAHDEPLELLEIENAGDDGLDVLERGLLVGERVCGAGRDQQAGSGCRVHVVLLSYSN